MSLPLRSSRGFTAAALALGLGVTAVPAAAAAAPSTAHGTATTTATPAAGRVRAAYDQTYRPQLSFSPARNWMNDPNGLLYYKGVYHLFFQYNPKDEVWGNMSWGHATSTDLVHWTQQPVAIPQSFNAQGQSTEDIFSGSAVVDTYNTTGLGTRKNPAMVAIYTSSYPSANPKYGGLQAQSLAYSLDAGKTWKKYAGNPVLNINNANFRDPKVFWYAPAHEWRMVVVRALDHVVAIYSSKNLKQWTHLSDFGPAGATGGAWECPDLFPMELDGNPHRIKWVMAVSINPGGINGGSAGQYFVGNFNGTTFTPDGPATYTPPAGTLVQGFESGFGGWQPSGTAFGTAPVRAALPGQSTVTGYTGTAFADSFHGGDAATGVLRSPDFTISKDYLNFLVGGGNHPHVPGTSLNPTQPAGTVFSDFESTTWGKGWTATGSFTNDGPRTGTIGDQQTVSGYQGNRLVNTFTNHDLATGTITSPTFTIGTSHINFLIGGGDNPWTGNGTGAEAVNLVVGGKVVRTATGANSESLNWSSWDVSQYKGQQAKIQIVDNNTGGWGHILVDQITFANAPAVPLSVETSVNLIVDGQVVRSATGNDSESLDWTGWDVRNLAGKRAHIEIVDNTSGGWGHILADAFTASNQPALSSVQRANWLDYGRDFYAAATFNGTSITNRLQIAWMNNWDYAGSTPTAPWRSANTLVRRLQLRTIGGRTQLVATPVAALNNLLQRPVAQLKGRIPTGTTAITSKHLGQTLQVKASFKAAAGRSFGVNVRVGNGQKTVIGYDMARQGLYLDRTQSGAVGFSSAFPSTEFAPLPVKAGQTITLTIYVDRSSVQVFADGGIRTLTEQVFPDPSSTAVQLFSTGGATTLTNLTIRPMTSIWAS